MAHKFSLLAIDDEPRIQKLLRVGLGAEGFDVIPAHTAAAGLDLMRSRNFDGVILNLSLPDQSGYAVLEEIRKSSTLPVLVLSANGEEGSKVKALDLGADDYIIQPFGVSELAARIRVALRHRLQAVGAAPVLCVGDVGIDLLHRRITRDGREVQLSRTEYEILQQLAEHQGKILTHNFILGKVRGEDKADDPQYLRVYIKSLRNKLGDKIIRTEIGMGYRLPAGQIAV
jgi:two-component system KDP operon response regulator KdpE